jgi:hypothetical protein
MNRVANRPGNSATVARFRAVARRTSKAPDARTVAGRAPDCGHLVGEVAELGATVRHQVHDLDDRPLSSAEAGEMDVDGSGA